MERISVFDIFKIGVGPSSSHTMGPWRAAQRFLAEINQDAIVSIQVELYGSLAKTGIGHGTDLAVLLGLNGDDPVTIAVDALHPNIEKIKLSRQINLGGKRMIDFDPATDLVFYMDTVLPFHSNGLIFRAFYENGQGESHTYYSVGGGFVVKEGEENKSTGITLPCPIDKGDELAAWCFSKNKNISEVVFENELTWRTHTEINEKLTGIWT